MPLFDQKAIPKNHAVAFPQNIIYLDSETEPEIVGKEEHHRMKMAWGCHVRTNGPGRKDTESWEFFDNPYNLWKWIDACARPRTATYIFGHNIYFDLQASNFFHLMAHWGWKLDFIYDAYVTYILVVRRGRCCLKFLSTTNFFEGKLEKLGKMVGLPKLDVTFGVTSDQDLKTYCRRDVEIIKLAMEKYFAFLQSNNLGGFRMSRAAQSIGSFRHTFMKTKIYHHEEPGALGLEMDAYAGGRTECFRLGDQEGGPFVTLDINSMYPFVMRENLFPTQLLCYRQSETLENVKRYVNEVGVIAECFLDTPEPIYAFKYKRKILFPTGKIRVFLTTPGIKEALRRGHLKDVGKVAYYKMEIIFKEFVDELYFLRLKYQNEGNAVYSKMIKILLNSLYGKFAQYVPQMIMEPCEDADSYQRMETYDLVTGRSVIEYKLMGMWIQEGGREIGKNSLVAVSAHITEYARLLLWSVIERIGLDRALYCDTDSVKIRKADLSRVNWPIHETDLGSLKVEDETNTLNLIGPKAYITDTERVIKGIPKQAVEVEPGLFEFPSFGRSTYHMTHEIKDRVVVTKRHRRLQRTYDKGIVKPGGSVAPFHFSQWPMLSLPPLEPESSAASFQP